MERRKRFSRMILFAPLAIAGFALFIWIVMQLWNGVLTNATGVRTITYWQAAGILLLSKILFGFGGGMGGNYRRRSRMMHEKFTNMTPEEKEKFKAEWRDRCNRWRRKDEPPTSLAE